MINQEKIQKNFIKDSDEYMPRQKRVFPAKQQHKQCECGGKLKARGATGCAGHISFKCNKCGKRMHVQYYKGVSGLEKCY